MIEYIGMKQLLMFIKKEFNHVFRDRKTLLLLFGLPIMQIVIFGFALTNEIKNTQIAIVDYSKDNVTTKILNKISHSKSFVVADLLNSHHQIESAFKSGKIKAAIIFQPNFEKDLRHLNRAQIQIIADASDLNTATAITNYLNVIIREYQAEQLLESKPFISINTQTRMMYNPELKGEYNFIPGIMAMIMLLIGVMMTSISIVKEKEMGTMEILLASPFKPGMVIFSKFMPYLFISLINVTVILLLSYFVLSIPVKGSLFLLYAESFLFILTALSLGLLISIHAKSQQVAMFTSIMATMLPTILLSGFIFPIENMPLILQWISNVVPSKWFFIIVKNVMIKGLGFEMIWKETLILMGMMFVFVVVSIKNFKIRLL